MNIGMVLDGNYPSDIRVRKEAEALIKYHKVFILCVKNVDEAEFEIINGVEVYRSIIFRNNTHKGIIDVIASINFIHPYFSKKLHKFIKTNNINVIHIHDLPLAKTGYLIGKRNNIFTVLDLHENYPAALMTWFVWRRNPIIRLKNKIFFGYRRWRNYEVGIIKKFDKLITVVDEMSNRLVEQHGIDPKKIVVVPNAEKKEFAGNFEMDNFNYFDVSNNDRFIISYVGGFGPHRGLQTAIEAMKDVIKVIPNALLVLVGPAKRDVLIFLNKIIKKFDLEKNVLIKGKEPFRNVVNIMRGSHVNIIPHISNEHTESAVPHKFYQILLSKKPLLVSDCAPMKRIIELNKIGFTFLAGNSSSFASVIVEIFNNYELAIEKAAIGFDLSVNGKLNWEYESKNLIDLYKNLNS